MQRVFSLVLILSLTVFACSKKKDSAAAPDACFLVDAVESTDPNHLFVFTNCSNPYNTYQWNFGDGYSSTEINPTHTYYHIGAYNVQLTVTNQDGISDVNSRTITIGHNTLTSYVINKSNRIVNFPKQLSFNYFNSPLLQNYHLDTLIADSNHLPVSISLPDNVLYDLYPPGSFSFGENDFAGHTYSSSFYISDFDILDNNVEKQIFFNSDTASLTLHFSVVPR